MDDLKIPEPTPRQVRTVRAYFKWTQMEGAGHLGVFVDTIRDFEGEKRPPTKATLQTLGLAFMRLGVKIDDAGNLILPA